MYKRILIVTALLLTIAGVAGANDAHATKPQVCASLHSGKIDTKGDPLSVTVSAPTGKVITGYCVKAGSAGQEDGGPVYVTIDNATTVTITHPSGKAVSHYSLSYGPAKDGGQGGVINPLPIEPTPTPTVPAETPAPTTPATTAPAAGQGSVPTPATAVATPAATKEAASVASLPYTAGNKGQTLMLVAAAVTALVMGVSVVAKKALIKQI